MRIPFLGRRPDKRSVANLNTYLEQLYGTLQSKAGASVTADTATQVSAVFACVNLIASSIATLPCILYRNSSAGKEKATGHNLYQLLHFLPNPETTAAEFWEMYLWNLLLTGYGAAYIKRDNNGFITELWNIPTANMHVDRNVNTKEMYYDVVLDETTGKQVRLYAENIMITRGKRFQKRDDILNPIKIAREAMGLGLALEEYAGRYFSNGAVPSGVVEYPGSLSEVAFKRFKDSFNEKITGLGNLFRVIFLENGSKFTPITNSPKESQAIEARKFQAIEIARFFNVPPNKIMDQDRMTYSNAEQTNIEFVQSCLDPWCVKLEQTIYKDTMTPLERKRYFAKFLTNALLRGDIAARSAFYHNAINDGWLSVDDVRDLEDMNPAKDGETPGSRYYHNGNFIPLGATAQKGGENIGQNQA